MPRLPGRRNEILEAFVRYVAERGYERTNLGDITDDLGMSKGTIVHHFGTKVRGVLTHSRNHVRVRTATGARPQRDGSKPAGRLRRCLPQRAAVRPRGAVQASEPSTEVVCRARPLAAVPGATD
ncbi:TetR/AcrR family transcriptional regulator [Mycobacterium sp. 852014-50255_SCH5639931]|uniref:TetR/AcrR family transcriptional regulator n=1 Tax=Mycobacterium sp. 852014-50255_SCH5639931 TaxID=1834112 RepID=UPI0018D30F7F